MKKTFNVGETRGMVRKLDDLGRVVLPIECRKEVGIKAKDKVEIFLIKDGFYIRNVKNIQ